MSLTTTTEIAGPVNVVFQVQLLRNAKALCPYFMGTMSAEIAEHSGTFTAKWRRIENLTPVSTPLSELTGSLAFPTRTPDQPSVTDLTASVQKFGNFLFLTEEVDLVNFNGQGAKLAEVLGINAGRSINRQQRNEMEDNSPQLFVGAATTATGVGVAGTASTEAMNLSIIAQAVNQLNRQDAMRFLPMTTGSTNIGTSPIRSSYWGICHVDVEEDIRTLTGFNSVETYAGQTETAMGEFGAVGGVRWISTTEASIDASTGATVTSTATTALRTSGSNRTDIYNSVIYGREAYGSVGFGFEHVKEIYTAGDMLPGVMMISHPKGSAGAADPLNEAASLGWKSWHAAKTLATDWGVTVLSGASVLG